MDNSLYKIYFDFLNKQVHCDLIDSRHASDLLSINFNLDKDEADKIVKIWLNTNE